MKTTRKRFFTLLFLSAVLVLPASAQTAQSDMNTILNDWALPIFLGMMVLAAASGYVKNYRLINDDTNAGNKKDGWLNVAHITGYVMIIVTAIGFIIARMSGMSFSIG